MIPAIYHTQAVRRYFLSFTHILPTLIVQDVHIDCSCGHNKIKLVHTIVVTIKLCAHNIIVLCAQDNLLIQCNCLACIWLFNTRLFLCVHKLCAHKTVVRTLGDLFAQDNCCVWKKSPDWTSGALQSLKILLQQRLVTTELQHSTFKIFFCFEIWKQHDTWHEWH